jgi:hypothetical protein
LFEKIDSSKIEIVLSKIRILIDSKTIVFHKKSFVKNIVFKKIYCLSKIFIIAINIACKHQKTSDVSFSHTKKNSNKKKSSKSKRKQNNHCSGAEKFGWNKKCFSYIQLNLKWTEGLFPLRNTLAGNTVTYIHLTLKIVQKKEPLGIRSFKPPS